MPRQNSRGVALLRDGTNIGWQSGAPSRATPHQPDSKSAANSQSIAAFVPKPRSAVASAHRTCWPLLATTTNPIRNYVSA